MPPLLLFDGHDQSAVHITRVAADVDHPSLVQWVECATTPRPSIHAFSGRSSVGRWPGAAPRRSFREPLLPSLCCFPKHSRCFRAVFDGRVNLNDCAQDASKKCSEWAAAGECAKVCACRSQSSRMCRSES